MHTYVVPAVVLLLVTVGTVQGAPATQSVPAGAPASLPAVPKVNAVEVHTLPVQYAGRVMPLDTLAREIVREVTGKRQWQKHDPVILVLSWMWQSQAWKTAPMVLVDDPVLRGQFGLPVEREYFSYAELVANQNQVRHRLNEEKGVGEEVRPSVRQVMLLRRLKTLETIFAGQVIRFLPSGEDARDHWKAAGAIGWWPDADPAEQEKIQAGWESVREAFLAGDDGAFRKAAASLTETVRGLHSLAWPKANQIMELEVLYNIIRPFQKGWWATLGAVVIGLSSLAVGGRWQRWVRLVAWGALINGFSLLSLGLVLRWKFIGHAPVSTMYESLVFMGWGVVAIGIIMMLIARMKAALPVVAAVATVILVVADTAPLESAASVLVPVLRNTMWLTFHVQTILLGYSTFALTMGVGHVQAASMALRPGNMERTSQLGRLLYGMTLVGCVFLVAGILFGAIWANKSWGRYWGWDPKETWSLITLLGYMVVLHGRRAGWFGPFGLAIASIVCFQLVVMTYYGVNFVLGRGLHTYGFSSGGQVWVGLYVLAEMAFVVWMWTSNRGSSLMGGADKQQRQQPQQQRPG